jgi:hypothetical protein
MWVFLGRLALALSSNVRGGRASFLGPSTKYLRMLSTEQCLAPSKKKILTPHPLSTQRVCSPPAPKTGGYTLAGRGVGGGSIYWKTPDIGLDSYSIIPLRDRGSAASFCTQTFAVAQCAYSPSDYKEDTDRWVTPPPHFIDMSRLGH